jgi:tryptophanyl-tRNA synthetase
VDKTVILTGLRANNDLHIGNYFGALLPIIELAHKYSSNDYQINLFVPDLHSFTTPIDHSKLYEQTIRNIKLYVAAGLPIDNDNILLYRQSFVPAHSELTWILDNFTTFSALRRMQQFEDKAGLLKDNEAEEDSDEHLVLRQSLTHQQLNTVSVGLFNYPVLMAADILLYDATYVPVGADQTQHLEFTRDLAMHVNNKFISHGELFTIPKSIKEQNEFFNRSAPLKIKDLISPDKKMSKSNQSDRGVIFLNDDPNESAKKIMSATTDNLGLIGSDPDKQPGVHNLMQILALLSGSSLDDVLTTWVGRTSYSELKSAVAEKTKTFITSLQETYSTINDQQILDKVARDEVTVNAIANAKIAKVHSAIGLRQ